MKQEELKQLRQVWAERVAEFEASGQSTTEWCSERGIKVAQLRYWLRKYRHQKSEPSNLVNTHWQPLEVDSGAANEDRLQVRGGNAAIEVKPGFNKKLLQEVVGALVETC